jgi:ATP-dependent Clp protease adaptor protein ClpS
MSGSSIDVKSKIKPNLSISEPPLYRVIYVNDEKTTMEFVVSSLIEFFEYTSETAETITVDIHEKGSAIVALLPYEIAEQKGIEVTLSARSNGFPLTIKIEPELP